MLPLRCLVLVLSCAAPVLAQGLQAPDPKSPDLPHVSMTRFSSGELGFVDLLTVGNTHTGGCAWIDYNGDLWPDLFITNGGGKQHLLYRNDGDGTFTNASNLVPKLDIQLEDAGVVFADLENDGDEDLIVIVDSPIFNPLQPNPTFGGPNAVYVNQGNGTFMQKASQVGLVDPLFWRNIVGALADIDRDGFIDVYLGRWAPDNELGLVMYDRILTNDGDGTFTDVSADVRVDSYGRQTLACQFMDFDLDGWMDLMVGAVGPTLDEPDNNSILYQNCDGAMFCDVTGDPHVIGNDAKSAMGIDIGDIENDGDFDVYITDVLSQGAEPFGNVLYIANGDGTFEDNSCDVAGVCSFSSWPCKFMDIDLDGWIDLWVGTTPSGWRDYLYKNNRDGTFSEFGERIDGNAARGGAVADYDGDGDLDIFFQNLDMDSALYRNDTLTPHRWIMFKLVGTASNRSAIGTLVKVTADGMTQMRLVTGGDSAHSQSELAVHFGTGGATAVDVQIEWPSGALQAFDDVATNEFYLVNEGTGIVPEQLTTSSATWSAGAQALVVTATTTLGGRSRLAIDGYGPLTWDAQTLRYVGQFGTDLAPTSLLLTSTRGGTWSIPVAAQP